MNNEVFVVSLFISRFSEFYILFCAFIRMSALYLMTFSIMLRPSMHTALYPNEI